MDYVYLFYILDCKLPTLTFICQIVPCHVPFVNNIVEHLKKIILSICLLYCEMACLKLLSHWHIGICFNIFFCIPSSCSSISLANKWVKHFAFLFFCYIKIKICIFDAFHISHYYIFISKWLLTFTHNL